MNHRSKFLGLLRLKRNETEQNWNRTNQLQKIPNWIGTEGNENETERNRMDWSGTQWIGRKRNEWYLKNDQFRVNRDSKEMEFDIEHYYSYQDRINYIEGTISKTIRTEWNTTVWNEMQWNERNRMQQNETWRNRTEQSNIETK